MGTTNGHAVEMAIPAKRYEFPAPEEVTLPFSGVTVWARRTSQLALMAMGADFGPVQAAAARLTEDGKSSAETFTAVMADQTARQAFDAMLEKVVRRTLVRPRAVDRPEDVRDPARQVWIDDIDFEDRLHLWSWNNRTSEGDEDEEGTEASDDALAFLPDEGGSATDLQPLPDGDGDEQPPE